MFAAAGSITITTIAEKRLQYSCHLGPKLLRTLLFHTTLLKASLFIPSHEVESFFKSSFYYLFLLHLRCPIFC